MDRKDGGKGWAALVEKDELFLDLLELYLIRKMICTG